MSCAVILTDFSCIVSSMTGWLFDQFQSLAHSGTVPLSQVQASVVLMIAVRMMMLGWGWALCRSQVCRWLWCPAGDGDSGQCRLPMVAVVQAVGGVG